MNRPRSRLALAAALSFLVVGSIFLLRPPSPQPRPDIVLIVWDTCRGDRVSVNGYGKPTSPVLDALAKEGVNFPYCFTPSPWTPPAHASLFSGLLPSRHELQERRGARVRPGLPLLPGTLRTAGYETVAVPANPILGVAGLLDDFETVLPFTPGVEKDPGSTISSRIGRYARARRERRGPRKPLFLFVNLMDSHLPLSPPRGDVVAVHGEAVAATLPSGPLGIDTIAALDHMLGLGRLADESLRLLPLAYDAGIHGADRATGEILAILREEGLYENAFIAVTGDHGECLGEHGELEHRMSVRDAALHVPLVVRWPGHFSGGKREDAQVRLQDLYPTILEAGLVRVPAGTGTDALSLAGPGVAPRDAVAQLETTAADLPAKITSRFDRLPPESVERLRSSWLVLREAARGPSPRKWIRAAAEAGPLGPAMERERLYDLKADPSEDRDLMGDAAFGAEAARLRSKALEAIR